MLPIVDVDLAIATERDVLRSGEPARQHRVAQVSARLTGAGISSTLVFAPRNCPHQTIGTHTSHNMVRCIRVEDVTIGSNGEPKVLLLRHPSS